jgi:hypothetical protein
MKTIDFKINNKGTCKYYRASGENDEYIFSENLNNLGIVYSIIEKFKSEEDLKAYMLEMPGSIQRIF